MKRFLYTFLALGITTATMAVPARPNGKQVTQTDGSTITIYQYGDEYFHWITNAQGEWLKRNEQGLYETTTSLSDNEKMAQHQRIAPHRITQSAQTAYPINLAPRGLIILVNFADTTFRYDKALITDMLTGENWTRDYYYTDKGKEYHVVSKGSARQYFIDQSKGQYQPEFNVIGPYQVSQKMEYYGTNRGSFDGHPEEMIVEACQLANEDGYDFSQYDANNDGKIDFVYVIYAGYGEADSYIDNTIWPHSYTLSERYYKPTQRGGYGKDTVYLDGKILDLYACGNEINCYSEQLMGIGNFCHEFGHVLGLPDLYNDNIKTQGQWDIMDYGIYNNDCNTPPAYSAYERFFLGWSTPTLLNQAADITLHELQSSNAIGLISLSGEHNLVGNDPAPTTFYLLENRQLKDWDTYLPGHGLILTKVTYNYNRWLNNNINRSEADMAIDLIEADGQTSASGLNFYGKQTDAFPAGKTEYTEINSYPITDIVEKGEIISFKFMGGGHHKPLAIDDALTDETIIAIYDLLGHNCGQNLNKLSNGVYIVSTNQNTRKVIIRN